MEDKINIDFSIQNVNSLNVSSTNKSSLKLKLYAVTKIGTDVIFLSDVRLKDKNNKSYLTEIENILHFNPYNVYKFHANSTQNKRGVAILIKKSSNIEILDQKADRGENYLAVRLRLENKKEIIAAAIYGPNNTDREFFENLKRDIQSLGARGLECSAIQRESSGKH